MSEEWLNCPKCHSDKLDAGSLERDYGIAWCTTTCGTCGFEWLECYTFARNEEPVTCVVLDDKGNPNENIILEPVVDVWSEDPKYTRNDWQEDARNGDTNLGYWEWVSHRRDFNELLDK